MVLGSWFLVLGISGGAAELDSLGWSAASLSEPSVTPGNIEPSPSPSSILHGDRGEDSTEARGMFEVAIRRDLDNGMRGGLLRDDYSGRLDVTGGMRVVHWRSGVADSA